MSVEYFSSVLRRSSLIQRQIDEEHRKPAIDRLRRLRLQSLKLRLQDRLASVVVAMRTARLKPAFAAAHRRAAGAPAPWSTQRVPS
jgi:hypothetical protein